MKKRVTNIRQHYVPQFYLRNFTNSKGKLSVYDSSRDNNYITSPAKECHEEYFYDLDTDIFKMLSDSKENYEELVDDKIRILNEEVSAILLNFLAKIRDCKENFQFPIEDRNKLYNFIVLQIIRTPFYRDRLEYLNVPFCIKIGLSGDLGDEKTQDLVHNLLILGVLSKLHNQDLKFNDLYFIVFEHLIDEVLDLKRQLEKAGKLFLINESKGEFICSSTPVNILWKPNPLATTKALITTFDDNKLFDNGDFLEFLTIHMPISSDVAIFLFDKSYNPSLTAMNQGIGIIQDWNHDLLLNLNYSTMLKSRDKVFSASGDYSEMINMRKNKINPRMNFRFGEEVE